MKRKGQPKNIRGTPKRAVKMRRMNAGMRVGEDELSLVLYLDDVGVMSESAEELQGLSVNCGRGLRKILWS